MCYLKEKLIKRNKKIHCVLYIKVISGMFDKQKVKMLREGKFGNFNILEKLIQEETKYVVYFR